MNALRYALGAVASIGLALARYLLAIMETSVAPGPARDDREDALPDGRWFTPGDEGPHDNGLPGKRRRTWEEASPLMGCPRCLASCVGGAGKCPRCWTDLVPFDRAVAAVWDSKGRPS